MSSTALFTHDTNSTTLPKRLACWLIMALCLLGVVVQANGTTTDICITDYDWVPGVPTIDGRVGQDPGWNNAAEFNLGTETGVANSVVAQILKDNSFVYLSFDVKSLAVQNTDDVLVLTFGPDGDPNHDWRFHIFPFGPAGETNTTVMGAPFSVSAWQHSGSTWTAVTPLNTDWPIANARVHKYMTNSNWSIEIKIPRAGAANLPLSNGVFFNSDGVSTFRMYMNVLRTSGGLPGAVQAPWPHGATIAMGGAVEEGTPARTDWAVVSLHSRTDCQGISIQPHYIGTTNPTNSEMRLHRPGGVNLTAAMCPPPTGHENDTSVTNIFFANVENNMTSVVAMDKVRMEYRIHDWGMPPLDPNLWSAIPTMPNPVTNSGPIPITPPGTPVTGLFNLNWTLTYQQSCNLLAHMHQCMLVVMSAPGGDVQFLNNGTRRNMDFVNTSLYKRKATISARGYGHPPGGRRNHHFALSVQREIEKCSGEQTTEKMTWIARGYRETGNFIIIRGKKYPLFDEVGGFGYVGQHAEPVKEWRQGMSGGGIKQVGNNLYTIDIEPESEAVVDTYIESVDDKDQPTQPDDHNPKGELTRWGLSLHAGVSLPHRDFNTFFNPGPSFAVDLEYRLNRFFSLEGIYGFHRFSGSRFGLVSVGDLNLHQFSFNGKVYGRTSPVRPFFNFGGGAYKFDPGDTRGGVNAGGGVQFDVSPNFMLEGLYNFHNVFTRGSNTQFSTVQGGVRFRF